MAYLIKMNENVANERDERVESAVVNAQLSDVRGSGSASSVSVNVRVK